MSSKPQAAVSAKGNARPSYATVILAGGAGRRMGGGKPLRMLAGATLLDRALELAAATSPHIAIAVRHPGQIASQQTRIITDDPNVRGPLGGLASALQYARDMGCDAALTIPTDMPFLPQDLGQRLALALPGYGAAIATGGGRPHPVCGLWQVTGAERLTNYSTNGRLSLVGFAEALTMTKVHWSTVPFDPFFNINGPSDLVAAERLLGD